MALSACNAGPWPSGDVHATQVRAHGLRATAEQLDAAAARVGARADELVYEGPAGERFRASVHELRDELRREAGRIRTVAHVLSRAAGTLLEQQRAWQRRTAEFERQAADDRARRAAGR